MVDSIAACRVARKSTTASARAGSRSGSDAVQLIRAADEADLAEIARLESLSVSTDADDAAARDLSRL